MAGAQADCGGVSRAAASFSSMIFAFANRLLSFAEREHARLPERRLFALPGRSLEIGFSAPEYARLCDRAYLPPPCSSGGRKEGTGEEVALAVLDYQSLPHMPRWSGPVPSLGEVTTALAKEGLRGGYDLDHAIWDIYDPARALGARVMQATTLRPPWEPSFPLRLLLHWAGRTAERGMIHAGTLGHNGRGVLLAGAGGAGKSGTTLSGILNGLASVGDDYVSVGSDGSGVEAQPVLRLVKQDPRGLQRLGLHPGKGALDGPVNWQGKIEFDFNALAPGTRAERLAMTAILIPHIAGLPASALRAASAKDAMLALAPNSLYQLYGSWREDFALIASVARALPAFHLDLGEDPAEIAVTVRAFIESGAA
jgi:hypothetical protein